MKHSEIMYRKNLFIICIFVSSIATLAFEIHTDSWEFHLNYDLDVFGSKEIKSPPRGKHPTISVRFNKNDVEGEIQKSEGTVTCNVGDTILFYCDHEITDTDYTIGIYHEKGGIEWTVAEKVDHFFKYNITADSIDNNSKIYCMAYTNLLNKKNITSSVITLNLDESSVKDDDVKKITYSSETYHNCDIKNTTQYISQEKDKFLQSNNVPYLITAEKNGSIFICSDLNVKYQRIDGYSIHTRIIYNKFQYILDKKVEEPLIRGYRIGLITGIAGTIILLLLVIMFLLIRRRKKEVAVNPPLPDLELYASPNQVVYAELALADTARNADVNKTETTYAQIVGFLAKKPPNK